MTDEITITVPRERPFGAVAGLVLGGVAARHELTLDVLDDLQLALETLLEREEDEGDVSVELRVADGYVDAAVGPFDHATVAELEVEDGPMLGLRRLLDAVVEDISVSERDGGSWVLFRKAFEAVEVH